MNICFSAGFYPTDSKPYAAFIAALSKQFALLDCHVVVIAPQSLTKSFFRNQKLLPRYVREYVDDIHFVDIYRPYALTFGDGFIRGNLTLFMNRIAVQRVLFKGNFQPDVIYAHFWTSAYSVLFYAIRHHVPLFVATGEDKISFTRYLKDNTIKLFRRFVRGVICVSTKNRIESVSLGLADPQKCLVLPNAVDLSSFIRMDRTQVRRQLHISEESFIVAYVGRFVHRKGSKRLSDAISLLFNKGEEVQSIFIGGSIEDDSCEYVPTCPGILYCTNLPHHEVCKYLNCADVFVLPTLAEGCSNSIVEAMACGLPIISSDLDFNYDILDSSNSLLINPMDISQLADAILYLKKNKLLREKMGENSYRKVQSLDLKKRASRILDFMNERK